MSAQAVQMAIGRACTDAPFRAQLKSSPDEALAKYDLTDEERNALKAMPSEDVDIFGGVLEKRVSKICHAWAPAA